MDGDPSRAQAILKYDLPEDMYPLIERIKPTVWNELKTEAIDFTKEFIWLDNDVYPEDRAVLRKRAMLDRQWLVEVDLEANPQRLRGIVLDYLP